MDNKSNYSRERERKSQDLILVNNPTDKDFSLTWDSNRWIIPSKDKDTYGQGGGKRIVPRYVAENYMKHMIDKLILDDSNKSILTENERRQENGQLMMNKWEEQYVFESQFSTNNPDLRRKYARVIWLGVAQEHGNDEVEETNVSTAKDMRPFDEQIIDELDKPVQSSAFSNQPEISPPEPASFSSFDSFAEQKDSVINQLT